MQGFREVVESAWGAKALSNNAMRVLHIKLSRTGKALRKWSRGMKKKRRLAVDLANDVIFRLDMAQEERDLSAEERDLRRLLKVRLLGFMAIERAMWKQRSRLTTIRAGDGNTKLFHLRANGRRRKNHIPVLDAGLGPVFDHGGKANILHQHFNNLLGTHGVRTHRLNWDFLNLPRVNLDHLDDAFEEEELKTTVIEMHVEKAPGPDGFVGFFFKSCWNVIKGDLLAALNQLHQLRGDQWKLLNSAFIVLLPKKEGACRASDYRPVSLMHSVAKIDL